MDTPRVHRYRYAWLPVLLLLGLALRTAGIYWGQAYSYFGQGDGLAAYSVAVDFGRGEERAQYIGQPNYNERSKLPGPLWAVWCFLCLRLGGSIYGVVWGNVLLNVALIYLTVLLAERTAGGMAGFWAGLFAATLPWPVYYSGGVYNPDVMGFLGALLFLALWRSIQQDYSKSIAWVMLLLFAMPQFHMSGLMLIPAVALALSVSPARVNRPWLVLGLLAGVCLYLPYIRGEMAHGWQNTHGMFSGKGGRSWDCLKALTLPLGLLTNWVPQWTRTLAEFREAARACFGSLAFLAALNVVSVCLAAFVVAGAFQKVRSATLGFFDSPRRCFRTAPQMMFLGAMICVPLGFALLSGKPFHTRYCLVLLAPLLALAGAGAAGWCGPAASPRQRGLRRMFLAAAIITTGTNVWLVAGLYHHQGTVIERGEAFTPSWRELDRIYQSLKAQAGPGRRVEVDDTEYAAGLPPAQRLVGGAGFVRGYVSVREKEAAMIALQSAPATTFKLAKAQGPTESPPAYERHGIRLTAVPGK